MLLQVSENVVDKAAKAAGESMFSAVGKIATPAIILLLSLWVINKLIKHWDAVAYWLFKK